MGYDGYGVKKIIDNKSLEEISDCHCIIEELIEISNPNTSDRTIFIFPEGALAGVSLDQLKIFKQMFSEKFSEKM